MLGAWALRSDAEIIENAIAPALLQAHRYDPVIDGDKLTFTDASLETQDQLELRLERSIGEGIDALFSVQWEMRFDSTWKEVPREFSDAHKAIRLDDRRKIAKTDLRFIELQLRYSRTSSTAVALPTIRTYGAATGGDGNQDPLRIFTDPPDPVAGIFDWQPGGDTKAPFSIPYGAADHRAPPWRTFVILPDRWIRVTEILDFREGEGRLKVIMSDEFTDPTVVIDDPEQKGKGFLLDRNPSQIDTVRIEFNSSRGFVVFDQPKYIWIRNFLVAVDAAIPQGPRPIPSTCAD
ncbi:MAG: hypothetical protein AB7Q81_21820 [Gammaproteobacteria bacterium]